MASFTDQILTPNPYIPQMPIQAMVDVGMYKQAQYNQGVQKIQSYIDNIAGVEIMNNTQKQHLQSKLDELGNNLKSVAAGDFSNQQLVNSVGGMATSIIKDPIVQNAVYSTQRAKNELATAQNLYKEGKSSINNVRYLQSKINEYANSKDVNAQFNDKYINYIDLNKKWQNLGDNLKKSAPEKSIDQPYKSDAQGNTIYYTRDKKGNVLSASIDPRSGGTPELDMAMKRITIKGVSAQAMYDAMKNTLTSDDFEQMKVDAWAHYEGKGSEPIVKDLVGSTEMAKAMLKSEIHKLNVDLINPKLTTTEKLNIQADINKYENKLTDGSFDKDLENQILALQNPATLEKAKLDTYFKKTLNGQANTLSNQSFKEELLANPYEAANHAREMLQETIRNNNMDYSVALMNARETKRYHDLEEKWKNKNWEDQHPGIVTVDRAIATETVAPTIGNLQKDISQIDINKTRLDNDYGKILNLNKPSLDLLYSRWKKDPAYVTGNNALKYVQARDAAERQIVIKNNIKELVEEGSKKFDKELEDALLPVKGLTDASGKTIFTAKEIYDVDNIIQNNYKVDPLAVGTGGVSLYTTFNEANLRKNIGTDPKKLEIANALIKQIKGETLNPKERMIANRMSEIHREIDPKISKIEQKKFDYQTKTIGDLDPFYQEQVGTLDKKNERDMRMLQQLVGNTITDLNSGLSLDLPAGARADATTLSKMMSKTADGKLLVTPTIIKKSDGSALVILQEGDNVQTIPVTSTNFAKYYPEYAKTNPYNTDFHAIQASKYKTTNISKGTGDKPQDYITAAHTGYEMPLLAGTPWANKVRWDIIGDQNNDGDVDNDRYGLRLFINNNGTWIPIESQGGFKNAASVQFDIEQNIGTATIEGLLKKHK